MVTLHSASPLDELEEAQAAVATSPASSGFQIPSGFKLKGATHTDVTCPLAETLESEFKNLVACISIFYGAPLALLHDMRSCQYDSSAEMHSVGSHAGALNKTGPIGPGPLPRRGNLGDVKYILQEVRLISLTARGMSEGIGSTLVIVGQWLVKNKYLQ